MSEDKPKNPVGRPTKYCQEMAKYICDKVATHKESLEKLSKMYDEMPNPETVNLWRYKHPEFSDMYMQALASRCYLLAEDTINIADDIKSYVDKDGVERIDGGIIRKADSRIGARRWFASMYNKKQFSDSKEEVKDIATKVVHEELMKNKEKVDKANEKDF